MPKDVPRDQTQTSDARNNGYTTVGLCATDSTDKEIILALKNETRQADNKPRTVRKDGWEESVRQGWEKGTDQMLQLCICHKASSPPRSQFSYFI
ncbi:7172_t:CDS:2 [Paraglomus occultum]|uniref:7172_t:CDS:1 n=1 Tax=Paraglomus occultum TaxID=144539 RepID=A0A9N9FE86_9GLOM|nr:7172_t:CDS:2 [Paraglomus occultum]